MAGYDFEFYETGTISVTAGQKAFTGTGTAWQLRGCEGALVVVSGAGAINFVSSLSTDAAGEFRTAWSGPTLADASYVMWLPSAVAATALANHQRLAEIIAGIQGAQPESAILSAFAALQGNDGKLPMFTGENTLELVEYIADAKGSLKKLAALELAANKAITTDGSGNSQQSDLGTLGRSLLATQNAGAARGVIGTSRPAFRAFYPSNVALANGEYFMTIPSTSLNVGNVWNGSQMVCNEAGIYRFECNFVTAGGTANTGTMVASIDANTSTIGSSAKSKDNWFDPVYASTVARLNVGDIVRFKLNLTGLSGSVEMLANRSYATGVLIG